jgi:hypothetical protein
MLRSAGAAIALPLLDAMLPSTLAAPSTYKPAAQSVGTHPRMICCYVPQGVNIYDWFPKDAGPNWTLSPTLQGLSDFQSDFTLISGLGHPTATGGHEGADTWLTGVDLDATSGKDYQNGISVDQVAARVHENATRFPSLQLGIQSGTGESGKTRTLSFDVNGTALPAENRPQGVFDRLFTPDNAASRKATLQRYAERRSILDDLLAEAQSLNRKLGAADQRKLNEYLSSVRETERRVQRLTNWVDVPKPKVEAQGLQLGSDPTSAHDRMMWIDVMLELSYLAFQTDTTRVITFEWDTEPGGAGDGGADNHHELSHHGGDEKKLAGLTRIDRFYVARLSRFLSFLKQTKEADGSMLDSTMVLYGSGMNNGEGGGHSGKDLPFILAGGSKLGLKHGQHLKHEVDSKPLSNVMLTVAQKMGVETDRFSDSTGTLTGLT